MAPAELGTEATEAIETRGSGEAGDRRGCPTGTPTAGDRPKRMDLYRAILEYQNNFLSATLLHRVKSLPEKQNTSAKGDGRRKLRRKGGKEDALITCPGVTNTRVTEPRN